MGSFVARTGVGPRLEDWGDGDVGPGSLVYRGGSQGAWLCGVVGGFGGLLGSWGSASLQRSPRQVVCTRAGGQVHEGRWVSAGPAWLCGR